MVDRLSTQAAPILSIIVPVYGVEDYVGDCLDSIFKARGFAEKCELIIVDDGSIDRSMDVVMQRCHDVGNTTIIRQKNAGLGAARNTGIANSRGRYLWFVDSDDEICADAITLLVDCITRHAPDVIAFEFETIGDPLDRLPYLPIFDEIVDPIKFMTSGRPPSPVQFYVFESSLMACSGHRFKAGIYHEDALFTPLALASATSLVRLSSICYRYRRRPGSIMSVSNPKKHLADMLTVAEELGGHAEHAGAASPIQKALAREVGFALAAAHYYAVKLNFQDLASAAPFERVFAAGKRWVRHFSVKPLINYGRLLILSALSNLVPSGAK